MTRFESTFQLLIAVLVGVGFAVGGGYLWFSQTEDIDHYEPVDATVVSSEVGYPSGQGGGQTAQITYEYTVDGRTYESSNVFPGPGEAPADDPQGLVEDHPEGSTVTAYYDPANPSRAFLVQKRNVFFPVAMIGVGLLTLFVSGRAIVDRFTG